MKNGDGSAGYAVSPAIHSDLETRAVPAKVLERPDHVHDGSGPGHGFVITAFVLVFEEKIDCLLHELLELFGMEQIFLHIFFFAGLN